MVLYIYITFFFPSASKQQTRDREQHWMVSFFFLFSFFLYASEAAHDRPRAALDGLIYVVYIYMHIFYVYMYTYYIYDICSTNIYYSISLYICNTNKCILYKSICIYYIYVVLICLHACGTNIFSMHIEVWYQFAKQQLQQFAMQKLQQNCRLAAMYVVLICIVCLHRCGISF